VGSTLAMVKPSDPVLSSNAKRLIRAVLGSGRVTGNTDVLPAIRKFPGIGLKCPYCRQTTVTLNVKSRCAVSVPAVRECCQTRSFYIFWLQVWALHESHVRDGEVGYVVEDSWELGRAGYDRKSTRYNLLVATNPT
jgi:hypothetical protein